MMPSDNGSIVTVLIWPNTHLPSTRRDRFHKGTAIKPRRDDDYDVDADAVSQALSSAEIIGRRLKVNKTYERTDPEVGVGAGRSSMPTTLELAWFLPASRRPGWLVAQGVPAVKMPSLTDRRTWVFRRVASNPQGYVAWFKDRMRVVLEERRQLLAQLCADVQGPHYKVKPTAGHQTLSVTGTRNITR